MTENKLRFILEGIYKNGVLGERMEIVPPTYSTDNAIGIEVAEHEIREYFISLLPEERFDYDHNGVTFVESISEKDEGYNSAIKDMKERIGDEG